MHEMGQYKKGYEGTRYHATGSDVSVTGSVIDQLESSMCL